MRIVGIEGTAWNASAAVFDSEAGDGDGDVLSLVTDPYVPDEGGIHPREASEHISSAIPGVIDEALEDVSEDSIDAVAFSRGPGLGPCLRVTATAARALSLRLDVPLVGVNHTVAHIEMGRFSSGFEDPVALDAAGANTMVTTYRNGRYRILGETMDTGVGNSLDKFGRHVGLSHPGGPKIEELASSVDDSEYVELPYTVKGMDFSFSGIINAAQKKYDDGVEVERLAYSVQENVFGMLTEVCERALALTGKDTLVVGGGVSRNSRLREMLEEMCDERGAEFQSPEPEYLSDNAGMIAVLGYMMYQAGETVDVKDSHVKPDWRPDEVDVVWRDGVKEARRDDSMIHGAEAVVKFDESEVTKTRLPKSYRSPSLDAELRRKRTVSEARLTSEARKAGVPTPAVLDVDSHGFELRSERIGTDASDLSDSEIDPEDAEEIGRHLACLHSSGIAHGDPTTRNMVRSSDGRIYLIDFGLSYATRDTEDFGMDVHVLRRTLEGTVSDSDEIMDAFWSGYSNTWDDSDKVHRQVDEIEERGRYL
ncbi:bifunctional N(6)-L-threonylcarbamoyladenine synthase/serine/threonine protein kinase [Halorutilales archaeon Cl-col2-1]